MRVIAGDARRLQLVTPKGNSTRPTSDKVKETLFNILAPDLYDVNFLDLFAGSGGIGIEALSRGASFCTFIEKDKEAVSCIRKNLETTHYTERAAVYAQDVLTSLYNLHPARPYDIVFMDPPYRSDLVGQVLSMLARLDITGPDTLIIAELPSEADLSFAHDLSFHVVRVKEYKNNKHAFIRHRKEAEDQ